MGICSSGHKLSDKHHFLTEVTQGLIQEKKQQARHIEYAV